jgi:hypothetical protein
VFVDYTTDIWAQLDQPLDPASVNTKNVYLKLDTTRLPAVVTWDSTAERIHVRPLVTLALLTTYTVELSPNLRTAGGQLLGLGYVWQFTTGSVRHPSSPRPADRSMDSPFVVLSWGGNESTPGPLVYELYAGTDSAQVAARALPYLYRGGRIAYLPALRWHEHGATYWSITVENVTLGERYNGAVWRFDTPPEGAPIDSVDISTGDYGYQRTGGSANCYGGELITAPNYRCIQGWVLGLIPPPAWLAGMRWDLTATPAYADSLPGGASVWATLAIPTCTFTVRSTVDESAPLAVGRQTGPRTLRFDSDALTAHIEATVRRGGLFGYALRSQATIHFVAPFGLDPGEIARLVVYYYKPVPPPAAGAGAGTSSVRKPSSGGGRAARFPLDGRAASPFNSR